MFEGIFKRKLDRPEREIAPATRAAPARVLPRAEPAPTKVVVAPRPVTDKAVVQPAPAAGKVPAAVAQRAAVPQPEPSPDATGNFSVYSGAGHINFYESFDDLPDKRVHPDLGMMCKTFGDIVVMKSGLILCAEGYDEQHLKVVTSVIEQSGIQRGGRAKASQPLVTMLLSGVQAGQESDRRVGKESGTDTAMKSQARKNFTDLIRSAYLKKASDVHLRILPLASQVMYRINGILGNPEQMVTDEVRAMANVAYNFESDQSLNTLQPNVPQNASALVDITDAAGVERQVRVRIATVPASGAIQAVTRDAGSMSFDMVFRLLGEAGKKPPSLHSLGYAHDQEIILSESIHKPNGLVVVAGPTGSGKSTTLASMVFTTPAEKRAYTAEAPIEFLYNGKYNITQVPAHGEDPSAPTSFANLTRAFMRLDPDIILVGETRDKETASAALEAAITGHLVLTTLHVSRAVNIPERLFTLGIDRERLANPDLLRTFTYQRLVQKLCPHCKVLLKTRLDEMKALAEDVGIKAELLEGACMKNPKGCDRCERKGESGRRVLSEVILLGKDDRRFIERNDMNGWVDNLKERGWEDIQDHGRVAWLAGQLDIHSLEAAVDSIRKSTSGDAVNYTNLRDLYEKRHKAALAATAAS